MTIRPPCPLGCSVDHLEYAGKGRRPRVDRRRKPAWRHEVAVSEDTQVSDGTLSQGAEGDPIVRTED